MATWNDLTADQKNAVQLYHKFVRGTFAELAKLSKNSNAVLMNQFAAANVDAAVASLDAGESIPNPTDYAGAVALTKEEFLAAQTILRGLSATQVASLALLVKLVGINAG